MKSKTVQEFKETEIGKIPVDWDYEILDNYLTRITYGFTCPMPTSNDGPYMVTATDLKNNMINFETCRKTTSDAFENSLTDKSRPKINDILLSKDGTLGRVGIVNKEKICINQSVALLQLNSRIFPNFLYWLLLTPIYQQKMIIDSDGTAIQHIYITRVNKMHIGIPEINEQKRISYVLQTLDNKIQNLQNQNKILEQIAQAIFKSWFVDFDGVTEFEDSELGKIPTGWKSVLFKEFGECVKGFSYRGIEKFSTPQGFEFVTLNSIKEGGGFKKRVTWLESDRLKERHFVKELDLIIANTEQTKDARLLSTPALVQFSHDYTKELAVYSHHITRIDSKILNSKFYLYSLFLYQQKIIANAYHTGTGVWGFDHTGFLENHFIIKPNQEILNRFEKFSFKIHSKIIKNEKSISILTKTCDKLLPKLMSGEIRV